MLLYLLLGCDNVPIEETSHVEIPIEAYEWSCADYAEHTEIEITAGVCNDFESLTASVLLINDEYTEQEMYHEGGCWWYSLILQEENCIEVQEIIITAEQGVSNGR
tara:strand:- start:344 stop:661 length:318 start_codon:yes stop_codon:yes gene_type:complete